MSMKLAMFVVRAVAECAAFVSCCIVFAFGLAAVMAACTKPPPVDVSQCAHNTGSCIDDIASGCASAAFDHCDDTQRVSCNIDDEATCATSAVSYPACVVMKAECTCCNGRWHWAVYR